MWKNFLALVKEGERKEAQGQTKEAIALYKEAVAIYGGDFLPEELYSPWAVAKQEELRGHRTPKFYTAWRGYMKSKAP